MAAFLTTSWDDGHPLDLRVAELLTEYRLPGTFYVPRTAGSGTMSAAQLAELSEHFEIGGHTLDHRYLTRLDDAEAIRQITDARSWIQDTTGKPCTMFCPPAGKYTRRHVRMIRDAGYLGLRSVELLSIEPPRRCEGLMVMGTTLQAYAHRRLDYAKNTAKRAAWGNLLRYIRDGSPVDWERLAEILMGDVLSSGGVFHLWGHSWEIERTGQWPRLREVLRKLSEHFEPAARLTNGELCQSAWPRAHPRAVAATAAR